jgi:hypothetical protein
MEYFALYPKKESGVQKIQKGELYYNSELQSSASDDYSWNTTLAKQITFPTGFWLTFDTKNLIFDYAKYSTLFLVSGYFLDIINKYCSKDIQYVKVNMVDKKTKENNSQQYYFVKFIIDHDWIDMEKSNYEQKYDYITKQSEIIKYTNLKLKENIDSQKSIFILNDRILGRIIYVNLDVKKEIIEKGLDKNIHIIPIDEVAAFHNEYYFL